MKEITQEEYENRKKIEELQKKIIQDKGEKEKEGEEGEYKEPSKEQLDTEEEEKRRQKLTPMDEQERQEKLQKVKHLECKNGGRSVHYTWTQPQIEVMEIYIPIDPEIKGKDVKITYDSKHLKVVIKDQVPINGDFFAAINSDSLVWVIDSNRFGKFIQISFDKLVRLAWWDCAIKGDPILEIPKHISDVSKLSDIDESLRPDSNCFVNFS